MATLLNLWKQPPKDVFLGGESLAWRRYRGALWQFKWVILLVTMLGTGVGAIATRFLRPQFEARATVVIGALKGGEIGQPPIPPGEAFQSIDSWLDLLKTRRVLDSVVLELQLYVQADSAAKGSLAGFAVAETHTPGAYRFSVENDGRTFRLTSDAGRLLQLGALGDSVGRDFGFVWAPGKEQLEPGTTIAFQLDNLPDVSDRLAERIRGKLDRDANLMFLTYRGANPKRTAAVLDAVANRFVEVASELKRDKLAAVEAVLADQRRAVEDELRHALAGLETSRVRETYYGELQARHEKILLDEASRIPDVRVLNPAAASLTPVNGRESQRLILLALLASLALGLGAAFVLDRLDPRVKSPDELGSLGLRILGTLPHINTGRDNGRPGDPIDNADEVVEAFRLIRLNVTDAHGMASRLALAVSSPKGSEGKSFVATNLALSFSYLGFRTLVLDADVRRGRVHRLLGGTRRPGLTDYLRGTAALEHVVQPTSHQTLYRIASGSREQNGPDLLQSAAMASLVADLRSSYDVLIIDTPPIGVGADALTVARLVGNLVVVVRTGSTDRELTAKKLDLILQLPVRVLGAILNDVPARGIYRYYGSAYYSSYLPGYETRDEARLIRTTSGWRTEQ
ncbi:MAG: polysaccharide biosynthesis tyrosine autokinase [Gemmatimonadales bacterium]|jgi:capsular exopolysaccharide synthesis family protein